MPHRIDIIILFYVFGQVWAVCDWAKTLWFSFRNFGFKAFSTRFFFLLCDKLNTVGNNSHDYIYLNPLQRMPKSIVHIHLSLPIPCVCVCVACGNKQTNKYGNSSTKMSSLMRALKIDFLVVFTECLCFNTSIVGRVVDDCNHWQIASGNRHLR